MYKRQILSVGLASAFFRTGEQSQVLSASLLVGYAGIVVATVLTSSRQLGGRLTAEAESTRQKRDQWSVSHPRVWPTLH